METSNWKQKVSLRWAEIEPSNLIETLEEVNSGLPKNESFCYLMADYWNGPGCFGDFSAGKQELRQRLGYCVNGSAFGQATELLWRKIGSKLRLVLIAEADLSGLPMQSSKVQWEIGQIENDRCQDRQVYSIFLWGTHYNINRGLWIESRIPRPLTYPVIPEPDSSFENVRLHYVEYRDIRGRTVIHRRTHITAHLESAKAKQANQKGENNNGKAVSE